MGLIWVEQGKRLGKDGVPLAEQFPSVWSTDQETKEGRVSLGQPESGPAS